MPTIVFHSLRNSSTSYKLQLSGGDIKAVQGDNGHSQARMVTDTYATMCNETRKKLSEKFDSDFFQKKNASAAAKPQDDVFPAVQQACQLMMKKPELAQLLLTVTGLHSDG